MKQLRFIFLGITISFLSGCISISSTSVSIKKKISKRFCIAKDNVNTNNGLWYIKGIFPTDTSVNFTGEIDYSFIFSNPTEMNYNNDFIVLKKEISKEPIRYMIVKIRNDSLLRYYPTKSYMKFNELRKKLNVPDSLQFKTID